MADVIRMLIEMGAYIKALEFENENLKKRTTELEQKVEQLEGFLAALEPETKGK